MWRSNLAVVGPSHHRHVSVTLSPSLPSGLWVVEQQEESFMRKRFILALVGVAAVAASMVATSMVASASTDPNADVRRESPYEIGLIGDMPYGDAGRAQLPNVIADINANRLAFTTFDGDIKTGKERCDQPIYDAALANFH